MPPTTEQLIQATVAQGLSLGDLVRKYNLRRTTALKVIAAARGYRLAVADMAEPALDILVIGDAHAEPGEDATRFPLFGRAISDLCPDVVVCIGDWADMPSLSSYDKGKKTFEGRRYRKDIMAANDALDMMESNITCSPRRVFCVGNHEERIARVGNDHPQLDGLVGMDDLDIYRAWEAYDFLDPVDVGGVLFAHYFTSGVMGRAVGGVNKGRSLILKTLQSTVSGHSHELHHAVAYRADGTRIHGVDVGCSFDTHHDWAGESNKKYWRGLCMLRGVKNGELDLETLSFHELRRRYT